MAILKANLPADFTRTKFFYDWGLCEDYRRAPGNRMAFTDPQLCFCRDNYPTLSRTLTAPLKITTRRFAAGSELMTLVENVYEQLAYQLLVAYTGIYSP
jgi:hypothetical protein